MEQEEENDNKLLQKYLGEICWEEENPDNDTPTFTQEPKKRKLYLASTLNFPYKEGLPSWNNDNFKTATSSKKDAGIWKDQGYQAEMLEKHFSSAWQCKFMMDFYGIRGTCHYDDNQVKKCNSKDLDYTYLATGEKENTAVLLLNNNKDASKESPLNNAVFHSCREEEQQKKDNMNDDNMHYINEEDFLKASMKLMDAMDLTDESRAKVFRIEESMNIDRTEYLRGIRMSSEY